MTAGGVTYIATYTTYSTFLYRTDGTAGRHPAAAPLRRRLHGRPHRLHAPRRRDLLRGRGRRARRRAVAHGRDPGRHAAGARHRARAGVELARPTSSPPTTSSSSPPTTRSTAYEPWRILGGPRPPTEPPAAGRSRRSRSPRCRSRRSPKAHRRRRVHARRLRPAAKLTVRTQRLRRVRGATRWRVTGSVSATACSGRVHVLLGRRERVLKRVSAPLRNCRYSAILTTTSRSSGRWLQVRTVPSATLAERDVAPDPRRRLT